VADIVEQQVVLLGPEETERRRSAHGRRACCVPPSGLGVRPRPNARCGWARRSAGPAIGDVACRIDAANAALQDSLTRMLRSTLIPDCSAIAIRGRTPIPTTTKSASSRSPLCNAPLPIECGRGRAETEEDTVHFVHPANEVPDFRSESGFHWTRLRCHDVHLEPARTQ
jgi:hypothetical protein